MADEINKPVELTIEENGSGVRLDVFLSTKFPERSRTYIQKLIKNGGVSLDEKVNKTSKTTVTPGIKITIDWPVEKNYELPKGEDFSFAILYEDDDLIVIDKPSGIVVHPAAGNWTGTVVNALIGRDKDFADSFPDEDGPETQQRPGIVHRLDKDTSGCLVIAKNALSKQRLSESFASRNVKKTYSALSYGVPSKHSGELITLIGRHPVNRKKMAVVKKNGKEAITIFNVKKTGTIEGVPVTLLDVNILTGRTHQIRVHLAHMKLPVLGDKVYGRNQKLTVPRQMLHASKIVFPHPTTGKQISVNSPYPEDFLHYLNQLRNSK